MHILIIEDDPVIAANLSSMLKKSLINSTIVTTGEEAFYQIEVESYDGIILDWMLPDADGLKICQKLRSLGQTTPILMLTAKGGLEDKILGLEGGADDYLTKPFEFRELLARLKVLLRRRLGSSAKSLISVADLSLNLNNHEVKRGGKIINLSPREYALLEYLVLNKGKALDRLDLLHHVWGEEIDPMSNTVDVHIRYLRQKIDDPYKKKLLKTIKNKGYLCDD